MRRNWLMSLSFVLLVSAAALGASRQEIEIKVEATLERFAEEVTGGARLLQGAEGALVFPSVKKGALIVGGAYGEGALVEDGAFTGYYSIASASVGLLFGGQSSARVLLFLTEEALQDFKTSDGWEVGVDADVVLVEMGAGAEITTKTAKEPVLAFVFGQKGLLAGIDLGGSKISPIRR